MNEHQTDSYYAVPAKCYEHSLEMGTRNVGLQPKAHHRKVSDVIRAECWKNYSICNTISITVAVSLRKEAVCNDQCQLVKNL